MPGNCLPIIHFEKLATLLRRLWTSQWELPTNQAAVQQCLSNTAAPNVEDSTITHPSPFTEKRAKHGKRLLRMDGQPLPPTYLAEILHELYKLRDMQVVSYFSVEAPVGPEGKENPSDHRTIVGPTLPFADPDVFLDGFTRTEKDLLIKLEHALRRLSSCEIRALGTHSDVSEAIADIEFEIAHMKPHARKAQQQLTAGECFLDSSNEMFEFADEAWRKSARNKSHYGNAHRIVLSEIPKSSPLYEAFQRCQRPASEIWDGTQLPPLRRQAENALAISQYTSAIAFFRRHPDQISLKNDRARMYGHRFSEGVAGLQKNSITGLPTALKSAFEKPELVASGVQKRLAEHLETA